VRVVQTALEGLFSCKPLTTLDAGIKQLYGTFYDMMEITNGKLCMQKICVIYSGGQRYSKMYRLKRYRYTIFEKKIE
jgi:hypothetical protein